MIASRHLVASAILCTTLAATPAHARCGDFGAIGVLLHGVFGIAGGVTGGLLMPAILPDEDRDYSYGRAAWISIGVGAGLSALYVPVDLVADCAIVDVDGDGGTSGGLLLLPFTALAVSSAVATILWANAPPLSAAFLPLEDGGVAVVGARF